MAALMLLLFQGRDGELLQCKSSKSAEVGWDAIKEVTAGAARYQTRFSGTRFKRVAVTNQRFYKWCHRAGRSESGPLGDS